MKRILAFLVLALILTGCAEGINPQPSTSEATLSTTNTSPIELTGPDIYIPQSSVEKLTGGAVRSYSVESDAAGYLKYQGSDLLVYMSQEQECHVTRLTGENCVVLESAKLPADSQLLGISANRSCYYSPKQRSLILLDEKLEQVDSIVLQGEILGKPSISRDMTTVYYATTGQIRALDLLSGTSRLLRAFTGSTQYVEKLCFEDTMLLLSVTEDDGERYHAFTSTQDGEIVATDATLRSFDSFGKNYYLQRTEGSITEHLFGQVSGSPNAFYPAFENIRCLWLPEMSGVLTVYPQDGNVTLDFYDLRLGQRNASVTLPGTSVYSAISDASGKYVWLLMAGQEGTSLYRWEVSQSSMQDGTMYTSIRYSADNPHKEGLQLCKERIDALYNTYGVTVCLDLKDIPVPDGYVFTEEYQVRAFQIALSQLEGQLAQFPEDFFKKTASITKDGTFYISLVREISEGRKGMQYWVDGNAYITLAIGYDIAELFLRNFYYAADTYIFGSSGFLDRWTWKNPDGFDYDYNYKDYLDNPPTKYLEGDKQAFVDAFSTTYPKEDRAAFFTEAFQPNNAELFKPKAMQEKLLLLCKAIRDAYGMAKEPTPFSWEQYLEDPLPE